MDDDAMARRCADVMWAGDKASQALGIEIEVTDAGHAKARMTVREDMVNGLDVCHGGLVFALGDTAFAFACNAYNRQSFAASCNIDFIRPAKSGDQLLATAAEEHRGRRSGYYTIRIENQRAELVAIFRGRCGSNDQAIVSLESDT